MALTDDAIEQIKDMIVSGELRPGDRLVLALPRFESRYAIVGLAAERANFRFDSLGACFQIAKSTLDTLKSRLRVFREYVYVLGERLYVLGERLESRLQALDARMRRAHLNGEDVKEVQYSLLRFVTGHFGPKFDPVVGSSLARPSASNPFAPRT